uniref:Transporter n=1 Tax=Magallana gigas TaxID=29159 RepID=A0A8W8NR22_MAGGI|nr:sodium- and chloride-dependent glycine transporter 2 [Crassostrea gigas]XP_019927579.2 sodium- and chloride-dependent glycine transporter 2 [Crassostrea gigas]XP_034320566.1 sodium- and chloride-dependent glycine transporter 2 [Crassostrea gigas]XP_034320572.1 sodium- and chloride-dependent glycine transporter 2 [Crassostrea gigas]
MELKEDHEKITLSEDTESEETEEREKWDKKAESILSMLGFCVGLGNIWRFPYLCMRNGGGAFLIPFLFFLFFCGLPLYTLEVTVGQFSGKGIVKVWDVCPIFRGVGFGISILSTISCSYYIIIISWTTFYLINSFKSPLPWTLCLEDWNTPFCRKKNHGPAGESVNGTQYNVTSSGYSNTSITLRNQSELFSTPEEEFWQGEVLHLSGGLESIGQIQWHLALCFLAAWVMVYLCLVKGVKTVGKVVYVTATLPYILLLVILIRGLTLPGSLDGVLFYITPDFERLKDGKVWAEAAIQIFYSSGIVWGALITMASYNKFHNKCLRDCYALVLAGEGTSIFGGFVVFSVLGYMAHENGVSIEKVVKSGPGLGFIAYPEALAKLPLPNLWAVLFFIMLLTVGLDSTFGTIEPVFTALSDSFRMWRKRRALLTALFSAVCFLVGLIMCTEGGMYVFQLIDWYSAAIAVPLFGFLECIAFGWIYGAEMFSRDVMMMTGQGIPPLIRICWCFITPTILLIIMIVTLNSYVPPEYGSYKYPPWAQVFGWFVAVIPLIPIPVFAYREIKIANGRTYMEKLKNSLRPNDQWGPNHTEERKRYKGENREYTGSLLENIVVNVTGKDIS